jgi:hypothetical protein
MAVCDYFLEYSLKCTQHFFLKILDFYNIFEESKQYFILFFKVNGKFEAVFQHFWIAWQQLFSYNTLASDGSVWLFSWILSKILSHEQGFTWYARSSIRHSWSEILIAFFFRHRLNFDEAHNFFSENSWFLQESNQFSRSSIRHSWSEILIAFFLRWSIVVFY